jgi:hypothetical protein
MTSVAIFSVSGEPLGIAINQARLRGADVTLSIFSLHSAQGRISPATPGSGHE